MFRSNIRDLMDKKELTVRELVKRTGMSSRTIQRAVNSGSIGSCELNTLAKIATALGVKTKRLYDEVDDKYLDGNGPEGRVDAPPQEKTVQITH